MRIAAFGDCHIGSYGKKIDERTGLNARLLDTAESLRFVTKDAELEREASVLLFAGDLYRTPKPSPTEIILAKSALQSCIAQLPIYAIPGNHDLPRAIGENNSLEPLDNRPNVGLMQFDSPQLIRIKDRNENKVQLAVLPYPNRAQLAASLPEYASLSPEEADRLISAHIETILRGLAADLDPNLPSILLAHLSIDVAEAGAEKSIMAGRDITIPLSAIPEEFTFSVFGHIHKPQDFARYGRPNVFYTGSTDRIDFGEESEDKSYVILDTDTATWQRIPIPCRKYYTEDIDHPGMLVDIGQYKDTICRVRIHRQENEKPNYTELQSFIENAGAWDFRGFTEDIQRTAAVRSEEIVKAESTPDLLRVWHDAKSCEFPIEELIPASDKLEGSLV
jgi:exonuclease SbcD